MIVELKKFNMKQLKFNKNKSEGPVIVLLGKRGTGKSILIKDILYHNQDLKVGTVMSGTESGNGFFSKVLPKCMIHNEYKQDILRGLVEHQKAVLKEIKKQKQVYGRPLPDYDGRVFCILDDCLYDTNWTRDKLIRMLFMNGRHWKVMLIIAMQYPMGIPPVLRTNIDYTFILRESNKSIRRKIYDHYAGMFDTFELFEDIMNQTTEDNECLVVANNTKSNKLIDQIFWYKANASIVNAEFRVGGAEYWARNHLYASDDDEDTYDSSNYVRGSRINVRKNDW